MLPLSSALRGIDNQAASATDASMYGLAEVGGTQKLGNYNAGYPALSHC
jgi:hypothetical protein